MRCWVIYIKTTYQCSPEITASAALKMPPLQQQILRILLLQKQLAVTACFFLGSFLTAFFGGILKTTAGAHPSALFSLPSSVAF
jgi:hypothetical protein